MSAQPEQAVTLQDDLARLKPEIEKVLPAHVTPDKFLRVIMTAIAQSPDLRKCSRRSLLTSCVKAAQDGLVPDGREAALVTYRTKNGPEAVYMPMVGGILKKVRNSGELLSIGSNVVHERDTFRYWIDDAGEHITFEPNMAVDDRGRLLCAYAIAKTKDGGVYIEVMTRSQIEQVKAVSKSGNNGPWGSWYSEMARKSVIRRLSKRLPMSTDLEELVRRDDELYELNQQKLAHARSGTDAAKQLLGLPVLPDADDAAAAADADGGTPAEHVDEDTGEVTIVDPPQPLPGFDAKKANQELRAAKSLKALLKTWSEVTTLLNGADVPLELSAAYSEMREALEQ